MTYSTPAVRGAAVLDQECENSVADTVSISRGLRVQKTVTASGEAARAGDREGDSDGGGERERLQSRDELYDEVAS